MPPAPTLPLELVLHSITLVDPEVDRATLVNCLRVSKACWETAARTLYCTMRIASATQFDKLFKAEDVDRERVRQCFSFVHRLEFGMWMPFDHETVPLLWSWAVPGQPLFPNVRQFLFHVKIYQGVPMNRTLPSDGIYIFDYLEDVCVYDHSDLCEPINHFLPSRDKRPLRSVTTHCELFISTTHYLWENAQRYHIYDCDNHREYQHDLWASYVMEADQGWKSRGEDSKLKLSLRARADEARELVQDFKSAGWSQTDDFQLEVGSTATTRPCELCGMLTYTKIPWLTLRQVVPRLAWRTRGPGRS